MKRYKLHDLLRAAAATFLAANACGNAATPAGAGTTADVGSGPDAPASDAAVDGAAPDGVADASAETAAETTADVGADAAVDLGADAPPDVAGDVVPDLPPDAAKDIAKDSGPEVAQDVAPDVAADIAADTGKPAGPFACVDPQPIVSKGIDTGVDVCKNGMLRRRKVVQCPSVLPEVGKTCAAGGGGGPAGECTTDADCTNKVKGGHCEKSLGPGDWCYCASSCETDADCGTGSVCLCGPKFGTCVAAKCNTGADCTVGDCVSYINNPGCGATALVCESASDSCGANSDCKPGEECTWSPPKGKYCSPPLCAIGRPFAVDGQWQTAQVVQRADWAAPQRLADLDPHLRQRLADHWQAAAQMEHASVAAFARLTLELLAAGAPPDLLARAQQAGIDEVRHAQACFALAQRCDGQVRGPGPLHVGGALLNVSLAEIAAAAVVEGCVFETAAALEARVAAVQAIDPAVRQALEAIADDEARHAELSWDIVRWALAQGDEAVRAAVQVSFDRAIGDLRAGDTGADIAAGHGVLAGEPLRKLRRHAIDEIIAPARRRLAG